MIKYSNLKIGDKIKIIGATRLFSGYVDILNDYIGLDGIVMDIIPNCTQL